MGKTVDQAGSAIAGAGMDDGHPVRWLVRSLPLLPTTSRGAIDYATADPILLRQIAEAADTLTRSFHLGTSAIGQLMAHAAPELEDGTVSSDAVEALGWLLSALGEMGAQMAVLALQCARAAAAQAAAAKTKGAGTT